MANSVTTIFLYDLQGNIISEMRSDGSYDDYIYVENTRVAKIASTGDIYYYHNDHLGTPIAMTDTSQTVVWKGKYKAFGEAQVDASSSITNNFRFPGQYYDEETGLHYNYHRYYDPGTGRYLSSDPIGGITLVSKIPVPNNLYLYAKNNPIIYTDPLGLFSFPPCPPGKHREIDEADFSNCMLQTKVLAMCVACGGSAITGYGTILGLPACLSCLNFELNCMSKCSKCVDDMAPYCETK